jgi:hypothetical protein
MRLPCAGGSALLLDLLFAGTILGVPTADPLRTGTLQASQTRRGTAFNASHVLRDQLVYGNQVLVPDHTFAEVMRFSYVCGSAIEGLSAGFKSDCGPGYTALGRPELASCSEYDPPALVSYGCWFFFSSGPLISQKYYEQSLGYKVNKTLGSGIGVNVGKSLRVDTRGEASNALGLPCEDHPLCEKPNAVQDKLYCERAVKLGYDSIQFARPHRTCYAASCEGVNPPELLLCTGSCMSEAVTDACPKGVEVRSLREHSYDPCECDNDSHVLNCGKETFLYGRPDNGLHTCPTDAQGGLRSHKLHESMKAPELYELLTFLKDANMVSHLTKQQHHARMKLRMMRMMMNVANRSR